jgi:hypothetical protein
MLAILLGAATRTLCPLGKRWFDGINFATTPLEVAIGPALLRGVAVVVFIFIITASGVDLGAVQHEQVMMTGVTDVPFLSRFRNQDSPPGQSSPPPEPCVLNFWS